MSRYETQKHDGLARIGAFEHEGTSVSLPAALDTDDVFPTLRERLLSNVPLSADEGFVRDYFSPGEGQPVAVHPLAEPKAESGDCALVANWHTALRNPRNYTGWLAALKESVPPDTAWYAPASALPSTACLLIYSGFDLFDYRAVDLASAQKKFCLPEGEFPASLMETGACGCEGCREGNLVRHNRLALDREIALVRHYIEAGRLRELMESRCRADAAQVGILRFLDRNYALMERFLPVVRAVPMRANTAESQNRAEIRRFADRVIERFVPTRTDVAVLLPCSARKPYSLSRSHKLFMNTVDRRAHELIVTSPLGLVPRELERIYPAGHYDVPVTGYWDREECAFIADILTRYFAAHPYRRVIAHLEGGALTVAEMAAEACGIDLEVTCQGHPTAPGSLRALNAALEGERRVQTDIVRGTVSWQFGTEISSKGLQIRGRSMQMAVLRGKQQLFSIDAGTGLFRPTFEGWDLIPEGYRVRIDAFVPQGDVLAPGITACDPRIREGDEVLVEGPLAIATGKALMGADEMLRSKRGVAIRVRKVKKLGE
ncbi:pseudouridine synthase [Methanoculleus sp. Wushi-C6]|uniref:Pseudouridine synthase n=1 Tax=Methanoculleus caldifontis TaxID=2651577 RepID=A0ABU3X2Y1_9EURY|nr:archaeosine synthase subunit alpha [Methanoculleus sp. Wushi-C6]MDV2482394.1 pseudouridine synthase [Methanoculleus sp. Wushi-C6]